MDKNLFAQTMQVAGDYYGKDLTPEVLKVYYEELGGMTEKELSEAIRYHIRTMKSFPQVAHLRPVNNTSQNLRKPQHHEHPEWRNHWEAAESLMRAKLLGTDAKCPGTYLIPLVELVDKAYDAAQRIEDFYGTDELNNQVRESACYGNLNVLLANEMGRA